MKTLGFLFLGLFLFSIQSAIAQEAESSGLIMFNQQTGKTKFIPENKRVTLTNYRGFKSSGKLEVISKEEVTVHGRRFRVDELTQVRRNYIGTKIAGAILLVAGQTVIEVEKAVSSGMFDSSVEELQDYQVSAAGFIIMGTSLPLLLYAPNYKGDKWTYQAISYQSSNEN
ncbi:MAG: hypothetical protein EA341_08545 [Mongoliibacter sp.]|uniref:hypothetical protein n=1 Tax=Mongoliibacter sp. TaxID=2022438 RepID=UPI0012F40100|nr:hypothetical protein [Mongoliibacter sp.]TVP49847.1 MAG: hypothetical protein EA341_08545 [Mongoliibacter sp.]